MAMTSPVYEVEFKAELTLAERDALAARLAAEGFAAGDPLSLVDTYVEATDSPHGGYDLRRYRDEGGRIIFAEKVWELVGGSLARREAEREASREEMVAAIAASANPVRIAKTRQPYSGRWGGRDLHVDVDTVQFDHSPGPRYFAEAEIVTPDGAGAPALKEELRGFLAGLLGRDELPEAWGMFTMALKKR
jgi:hypothetical protein